MMKIIRYIIPLLVIGVVSLAAAASAKAESLVSAELTLEDGEYTVGDPLPLLLSVNHPAGHQVLQPQLDASWGDFLVNSQSAGTTITNPDGSETTNLLIDARLFSPGTYNSPPLIITVSDAVGQLTETTAQPVSVDIASVLVEGDADLRDIKPQAALPYIDYLPWIAGVGALALGMGGLYFIYRRQRSQLALAAVDNRLPHEVAFDELNRVEDLKLPHAGRFKEHYTLVSDCIRVYMEKTYQFPVLERTTGEIKANLKRTMVSNEIANQFIDLLDESDLVKFSKFTPDVASARRVLVQGREIVEITKPVTVEFEDKEQVQINHPPSDPEFGKNGRNKKAEVTL
ncbi:MAG: hypothetical protein MUO57_02335 [Anaerolineales bacterium]|nr:hypothetical protein [Anaerolineales bacterium]